MLTLRFIPYHEHSHLSSEERVSTLVRIAKEDKIILIEGKLGQTEEAELIKKTMEEISERFKGIEIAEIFPENNKNEPFFTRLKEDFINLLLGNRQGFTIIGPATIVKEIKKDPNKIELLTKEPKPQKSKRK
jgi:hypothetical protein